MGIRELEDAIAQEERAVRAALTSIAEAQQRAAGHAASFRQSWPADVLAQLRTNASQALAMSAGYPPYARGDWDSEAWRQWTPEGAHPPPYIVAGHIADQRTSGGDFRLPWPVPFIGQGRTVIVPTGTGDAAAGLELLHALAIRIAAMFPHQARYTFVDPARQGRSFPIFRNFPAGTVRMSTGDIARDFEEVRRDIDRINAAYLDKQAPSLEKVPADVRVNERFEFIFVAEYPDGFDRRAIEGLRQLARNGPPAGKYLFIQWNKDLAGPHDVKLDDFEGLYVLPPTAGPRAHYAATGSAGPDASLERVIFEKLASVKPPERKLGWSDVVAPSSDRVWRQTSERRIETPVGGSGANQVIRLWFGADDEGRTCAHGMLGAMPGAGKSNLYHVLILGLAARYSPRELRMYLIDGKFGVEFQDHRNLPHADVVSLNTPPELSRSVLAELLREMEWRNGCFSRAGVVDLSGYRQAGQPSGVMPRILLLVDEYQELFEGDREGVASRHLLQLAQQGRSAGIHMMLGAQRFGVVGLMHQAAVMGNIHLRVAMQLPHDAVQALTEFGRDGRRLIAACDLPGKTVINDRSGDDSGNHFGKVAYLDTEARRTWIAGLQAKALAEIPEDERGRGIVCDGQAQPRLVDNPFVGRTLRRPGRSSARERELLAKQSAHSGGLDVGDWFAGERPFALWLGQEFNVDGYARVVVRRRAGEGVLVAGGAYQARYGMFAAMLTSVALEAGPESAELLVLDRSIPETPWYSTLEDAAGVLRRLGYAVSYERGGDAGDALVERAAELTARRRTQSEEALLNEPSIFLFIADADRVRALARRDGEYGLDDSELGTRLALVLNEGPAVGVHVVLGFSGYMPMTRTLDIKRLDQFRHRVALQASEDDSFGLVRSRKAAQLQTHGQTPVVALYCDMIGGAESRFKPYAVDDKAGWSEQWALVAVRLELWGRHGNG